MPVHRVLGALEKNDPDRRACLEGLFSGIVGGRRAGSSFLHPDQCLVWDCGCSVIYVASGDRVRFTEVYRGRDPIEGLL